MLEIQAQINVSLAWKLSLVVMDKTLTPSPWTTVMDYPNGLPSNGLPLKNAISDEWYVKKLRLYTLHLHCTKDAFLFTPHHLQPPFWITIVNKTTAVHKKCRLKSNQLFCGQLSLPPMWFSSSVFLEQTKWSSGCYSWFVLLVLWWKLWKKQLVFWFFPECIKMK